MNQRFSERSVVVTGAGKGIGRTIARVFAHEGARVLVVDRDAEAAAETARAIIEAGGQAVACATDVSQRAEVEAMVGEAMTHFGGIDVLVANAGIFPSVSIEEMTEADWDQVHDVNLKGAFFCVKAAAALMRRQGGGGRILLTSSITGPITGFPGWAHYGATKAGMLGFMRTAAIEFARTGITINAVLPGNIRTEGLTDVGAEYLRKMEASIPLGCLGEPEDIAYAMLFLASDEARYITGQTLVVDGGQTLPESSLALE
ncbi:3-oxoacyl-ACP reductase FabG [Thioalkalivibrio sulfidiphilus]|uniref:Short-chain dehydrogenase/reductase SDR n=1 Tax=Thioalkalivibrio sulfidiphilus (strain HL-EbGR7) TaxID=396588 RepID=B8GND4_THISH|nr:3-oxoacyl-ACP reductase FabG [Thioalkalivibrio sulfidiphilus]ACL71995.1 short-chain dehydrogenase/reductase SDR [Thioalkalivibrio sulfidiphilus HL-EbGr7]